ncbi:MAG: glycosyl transferase family 2 [Rhodobacteraceae bacterium]|nr:glycosyl transferase family 2 [Paracoccaceae bacterium]
MRILLHIGLEQVGAGRLQRALADSRDALAAQSVLFPRGPGPRNHTRLFMAVTDPDHIDTLRFNRGYIAPDKQAALYRSVAADLAREAEAASADTMILSCAQLGGSLHRPSELQRLRALLTPLSDDIRIVAHVDEPARLLARHYAAQVLEGRAASLDAELALAETADWWQGALDRMPGIDPQGGLFEETQGAPFWLDYTRLVAHWEDVFGAGSMTLRPYDPALFNGTGIRDEIAACFDIAAPKAKVDDARPEPEPSAAWIARAREMNTLFLRLLAQKTRILPRKLWKQLLGEVFVPGAPIDPGSLSAVSARFAKANTALAIRFPALAPVLTATPAPLPAWTEADPTLGFRSTQYLVAFMHRIDKATREERASRTEALAHANGTPDAGETGDELELSDTARKILPDGAVANFERLKGSPYAPHNRLGAVNEEELAAAFTTMPARVLPEGSSGNVIVGCMKNEAPYILEWVAYHRAIGVDNFLIYTNGCEDGTDEILGRLNDLGLVHHRDNEDWKGKSPQQHALNQSLKEPVIRNADWIIHIDVDEFMNIRCGNGTLDDFFAAVPDATNVAMTWRLFGHNGVTTLEDRFVIDQFDTCAPKFCPKPHTVWGFKTMFKNIGAYTKISCHRPNKLQDDFADRVKWVNGSGRDMTREVAVNGWRSSKRSIGYDLLQLNHYALRSAESYLIKRQRGRALHVDRSIGINYWIRMDWSDHRDITIKRNIPRVRAEYDRLLADPVLREWHDKGFAWHRAKADELHGMPEFEDLYQQALTLKLTETERVAYALTLDMES